MSNPPDPEFEALLEFLRRTRGFDFTAYKRPSLVRRITKRMDAVNVHAFADYEEFLETHPNEYAALFDTILINVTSFYRDAAAWDCLAAEIIPQILAHKAAGEPVRVWSAGCASGEEAYTIAILLADAMGLDEFRRRAKIYATDADEHALSKARQGTYVESDLRDLPAALRDKYLQAADGRFLLQGDLRRAVIFGRLDLLQDAPISRLDLLVCRNTLMYFNAEAQNRILARFHFSLADQGYLFLGKSELLPAHSPQFTAAQLKHRIFAKVPAEAAREPGFAPPDDDASAVEALARAARLRELAFQSAPLTQIVVDERGRLALANAGARELFGLTSLDLGRPFAELELSYRPVELRARIEQARAERRIVTLAGVQRRLPGGEEQILDVQVVPLLDEPNGPAGVCISFADITVQEKLRADYVRTRQELETAWEELQSANEELQAANEELQSSNEELETTNEELQSTNEELETSNEELQCANAELQTIAEQGVRRLAAVVRDSNDAITVQDFDGHIEAWNRGAQRMYGYSEAEALGRNSLDLVPEDRRAELRDVLERLRQGESILSFETQRITKDGRIFDVSLTLTALADQDGRLTALATTERDITSRNKLAEERLQRAPSRMGKLPRFA